jgi:hypothetical protein
LYLGLVVDAKYYKGSHRFINATSVRKQLTRVLISAFVIIPLYICPVFFIQSSKNPLLILIVKFGMPTFIMGLLLNGFSKTIYGR